MSLTYAVWFLNTPKLIESTRIRNNFANRLTGEFSASMKLVHNGWQEHTKPLANTHYKDLR